MLKVQTKQKGIVIDIPPTQKNVGIKMSGGTDSSIIAFDSISKTFTADFIISILFTTYLWEKISVFSHPIKSKSTLVSKKFIIDLKTVALFNSNSFFSKACLRSDR